MKRTPRLHRSWIGLIAGILAVSLSAPAFAKVKYENSVKLHWAPIDKARSYQLQVLAGEKVILEEKDVTATSFTAILPAGKLAYRLRTVDVAGRAGSWSKTREFTILPGPPLAAVTQESELPYKGIPIETALKWEDVEDATAYRLRIWKSDQIVFDETVSGISAGFKVPEAGQYKFALASIHQDLTGVFGTPFEFSAIEFKLSAAKELSPTGRIAIQDGAKIKLKWSEVQGAEGYEVELIPQKKWKIQATVEADPAPSDHKWKAGFQIEGAEPDAPTEEPARKPAAVTIAKPAPEPEILEPKKFTTRDNSLVIPVPSEGSYTWKVRALAGMSHGDEKRKAGAQGPSSEAELETFRRSGD